MDFDIVLFGYDADGVRSVLAESQGGPDEVNEGFWFSTRNLDGEIASFQVVLLEPGEYVPCPPEYNPSSVEGEPFVAYVKVFDDARPPVSYP